MVPISEVYGVEVKTHQFQSYGIITKSSVIRRYGIRFCRITDVELNEVYSVPNGMLFGDI